MTSPDADAEQLTAAPDESPTNGRVPVWQPVVDSIGPKIRELRTTFGLSLQQLARRADVSAAAIHKVERGEMVPTITTLLKLAASLDRPIGYFVEQPPADQAVAAHTPAGARPELPDSDTDIRLARISGPPERFRAAGVVATLAPGAAGGNGSPPRATEPRATEPRPGEDLVVVLHGTLEFEVAGQAHTLQTGDALHYPTERSYHWTNPGPGTAEAVWISVSDGAAVPVKPA